MLTQKDRRNVVFDLMHLNERGILSKTLMQLRYSLNPFTDVNECLVNNGDCDHSCTNLVPGHQCSCRQGYMLDSDNRTCNGKE